jgi:hypothetical protein
MISRDSATLSNVKKWDRWLCEIRKQRWIIIYTGLLIRINQRMSCLHPYQTKKDDVLQVIMVRNKKDELKSLYPI